MRTRDTYFEDYGLPQERVKCLRKMCRYAPKECKTLVLFACKLSNRNIYDLLYQCLTSGDGYNKLSKKQYIPLPRQDFYGYVRKALFLISHFCGPWEHEMMKTE